MQRLRLVLAISVLTSILVESTVYVHNTRDDINVEQYDCLFAMETWYCGRPRAPIHLSRDTHGRQSCEENGGHVHHFSQLKSTHGYNISAIVHQWRSSTDKVEDYLRYLHNITQHDDIICECRGDQSFGRNCEYRLVANDTLEDSARWQLRQRLVNTEGSQLYGDILCYETLQCDSGQLCLDWREICDGIQQCMSGVDESGCDELELHECETDEYRCLNGMCIPGELFLDGEMDCLDRSDEMGGKDDRKCFEEQASVVCDDRPCRYKEWSCGDGQCISHRLDWMELLSRKECRSRRDQFHICEPYLRNLQWTLPNGRCARFRRHLDFLMTDSEESTSCRYLLRCAQSRGFGTFCVCRNFQSCSTRLQQNCSLSL
jgi:hypothetical protein